MAISKLILNGEVQMDVTSDTVTAAKMLSGTTATKNDGTKATGNIVTKSSSDLTASGATVTAPAGYYANAASKAVATTTHPNPTASINSSTGVVTASHTQTAGYVTAGTTTGTLSLSTQAAKTVTPTESVQRAVSAGYYTTGNVSVAAISSTYVGTGITTRDAYALTATTDEYAIHIQAPPGYYPSTANYGILFGNHDAPTVSFSSATGVVTARHALNTGVYIPGTQPSTTTSTYNLTTQAAQTFYPSTADQTISSYRWLTGAQTIKSVTTSNLTTENIAEGVVVKVGDSSNASRITQITGTHSGTRKNKLYYSGSGNTSDAYITYKDIKYTPGTTPGGVIEFDAGDTIRVTTVFNGFVYVNGERVTSTLSDGKYYYDYTLPDHDIFIKSRYVNAVNIAISIISEFAPVLHQDITENGDYVVGTAITASVNVGGSEGFTADQIAMRSISGNISVNATFISSYAFCECYSLTGGSFPYVTSIGASAFCDCHSLTGGSFPCVTSIGTYAFYNCHELSYIYAPSASYLGSYAFQYCSKLTSVNFPLVSAVTTSAFNNCQILSVALFSSAISVSSYGFWNCYSLRQVSLPLVQFLFSYAFGRCYELSVLSFPSAIRIYGSAFISCYNLLSLYLLGSSMVSLSASTAFNSTPISTYTTSTGGVYGKIYVPSSLYNSYITATNWTIFSARIVSM